MQEIELNKYWKKYIDKNMFRVVSSEYLKDILKNGIDPKIDPYDKQGAYIRKLFSLLLKLEKNGFIHQQDWGFKTVNGNYIVKISLIDLEKPFLDFTPNYKETYFYKKHRGGALVKTMKEITQDILKRKPKITKNELDLVKKLNKWSLEKSTYKNVTLFVNGSSKCFETAHFQAIHFDKKYWKSPFGRFQNFKKNYSKKFNPFLTGERPYYLRVIETIPAKVIYKVY